jgi:RNA polymerase sigma-70 factor (ECF subfamily)
MITDDPREARLKGWLTEHRGILVKISRAYASAPADQAELEQEMALQLWRSLPSFRTEAAPATWIYRVCLNTALTWRRDRTRRTRDLEPGIDLSQLSTGAASPAESIGEREMLARLYAAIQALPDFDRALVLLMLDGLAYRDMAEITGLTENHIGVALTRVRKRLAAQMKGLSHELE